MVLLEYGKEICNYQKNFQKINQNIFIMDSGNHIRIEYGN